MALTGEDRVLRIDFKRPPISPSLGTDEDVYIATYPKPHGALEGVLNSKSSLTQKQIELLENLLLECPLWKTKAIPLSHILDKLLEYSQNQNLVRIRQSASRMTYIHPAQTYEKLTLYDFERFPAPEVLESEVPLLLFSVEKFAPHTNGLLRISLSFQVMSSGRLDITFSQLPYIAPNMSARQAFEGDIFQDPYKALQALQPKESDLVYFLITEEDEVNIQHKDGTISTHNIYEALRLFY